MLTSSNSLFKVLSWAYMFGDDEDEDNKNA